MAATPCHTPYEVSNLANLEEPEVGGILPEVEREVAPCHGVVLMSVKENEVRMFSWNIEVIGYGNHA